MADESDLLAWAVAGLPGRLTLAAYLTEAHAPVYRLIIDILHAHQQESLTGVGRNELADLLADRLADAGVPGLAATIDLPARMDQLARWGNIDVWQDRAVRDEDFLRNRDRYQLTADAAKLHAALASLGVDETAAAVAVLAPAALADGLTRFLTAPTAADALLVWASMQSTTAEMARTAATWQAQLAAALAGSPSAEKVATARDIITRYVDMWGAGIDVHSSRIAAALDDIDALGDAHWRRMALAQAGADADDARLDAATATLRSTFALIAAWFTGPTAQAPRLRSQMASAVAPMIRSQRTVAAVGGHVSRRREALALASRLDQAPDDDTAWDLWCTATGLFSAAHHQTASAEPGIGTPSFWTADPAPVEARLRAHGPRALTGAPANMADRSAARAQARLAALEQAQRTAQIRYDLLALSGRPLSQMPDLDHDLGDALIDLLAALATPLARADGQPVTVTTADDVWRLTAAPLPGLAVLHVGDGRLVHADLRLDLTLLGGES